MIGPYETPQAFRDALEARGMGHPQQGRYARETSEVSKTSEVLGRPGGASKATRSRKSLRAIVPLVRLFSFQAARILSSSVSKERGESTTIRNGCDRQGRWRSFPIDRQLHWCYNVFAARRVSTLASSLLRRGSPCMSGLDPCPGADYRPEFRHVDRTVDLLTRKRPNDE